MRLEHSISNVQEHLRYVSQTPSMQLDIRLLEYIDRQVSGPYIVSSTKEIADWKTRKHRHETENHPPKPTVQTSTDSPAGSSTSHGAYR